MIYQPNGEYAVPLSAAMVEALTDLLESYPAARYIRKPQTAVALLNRGWIMKVSAAEPLHTKSMYYITKAGALALRIGARAPGA